MTFNFKPIGSGWFDCHEPCESICTDRVTNDNEFNDGCQPQPPSCETIGFGSSGFGGSNGFGGFGGYTECGWAATKGWTWWDGNNHGKLVKPKFEGPECEVEISQPGFVDQNFGGQDQCCDPCSCDVF